MIGHIKLSRFSTQQDYYNVAHQEAGTVFKIEDGDYEQVMLNMQTWFPTFEAAYVHPGTELYSIEGSGTMIVVNSVSK